MAAVCTGNLRFYADKSGLGFLFVLCMLFLF